MGKIISLVNQKGGVGKTTTSINIAAVLAYLGKKVLLVDIDPQGNATTGIGVDKSSVKKCVYSCLISEEPIHEVIINTSTTNLDIIPATIDLAGADLELSTMVRREYKLKEKLDTVKSYYDYIFIDCPPSLGLLTINSLVASDTVIIPVQCEFYALEGLTQLLNTIRLVQKHYNEHLGIEGVLLTMHDSRTNLGNEVIGEVRKYFGNKVYNTIIPRMVRLSEAPSHGKSILEYAPTSKGAEAHLKLAKEVILNNE